VGTNNYQDQLCFDEGNHENIPAGDRAHPKFKRLRYFPAISTHHQRRNLTSQRMEATLWASPKKMALSFVSYYMTKVSLGLDLMWFYID
jgi:hypothetical protein